MRLLLPPSETKRDGGDPSRTLDLAELGYPALTASRRRAFAALRTLARNRSRMIDALRLGVNQGAEVDRNRALRSSAVMPALERYTGVLYDALDAPRLSTGAREFADRSVIIHSALFGLLAAADPIPAYRLSHDSKLPGVSLKALWRESISRELESSSELTLDLRSEAYVALGPLPLGPNRYFLRVVTDAGADRTRALNHFNKRGKGELTRAILESAVDHPDGLSLLAWAEKSGIRLAPGLVGELELTVDSVTG